MTKEQEDLRMAYFLEYVEWKCTYMDQNPDVPTTLIPIFEQWLKEIKEVSLDDQPKVKKRPKKKKRKK